MKKVSQQRYLAGSLALTVLISYAIVLSAGNATAASARTKLTVVVPHRVLFTVAVPIYVAQEKGFFRENRIEVDPVFTKGGGENVQAVVSGDAQVGLSTGVLALLSAFAKGAPLKIVASEIYGMDTFWYVLQSSPVRKFEDLAGKKVGYSRPGSSSNMAVLAISDQLKAKGLKPAEPVSLGGVPDAFTAVKTGQGDAGWSVPPFLLDRVEKGEIRIVARGSEIIALNDVTMRVHFANADFASKNPETLKAFLRAHRKAVDFMFENPKEATKIWIKRADLKIPEATVLKTWEFYNRAAMEAKPFKGIEKSMEDAVEFKFLKKPLNKAETEKLFDASYLP